VVLCTVVDGERKEEVCFIHIDQEVCPEFIVTIRGERVSYFSEVLCIRDA